MTLQNQFLKISFLLLTFFFPFCCKGETEEKWIVLTTIQYPTEAVKQLAQLPGWKLVVVGDKKTPKDWHLDNCEYLSVEKQEALNYEILQHLPWNHYCRKNIGYLYAISKGAKIIYETDDDNYLIDGITVIENKDPLVQLNSTDSTVNIYAYFGQPTLWPRGYPLQKISSSDNYLIETADKTPKIGVIQGLVNKDPDVDAIYRLTQNKEVYFSSALPAVLKPFVFCPYNTQNTISHYDAFWGLFVPSTTAFRVCDIWRGYFMQRLLWDLDLSLCFTSPTAVQERNEHDYFKDFQDEQDLYLEVTKLLTFLKEWKDTSPHFETRFENLIEELIRGKFLKNKEEELAKAWIRDLHSVGYVFPTISEK